MKLLRRFLLNFLIKNIPSCILRAKALKLFGACIGDGCKIEQIVLLNYDGNNLDNLELGRKVYIGAGTILDIKDRLIIGDSTKVAAGCNFSTHIDSGKENYISTLYPKKEAAIVIGSNCWIGLSVTILCGVTVGSEVVIGACGLVNRDIPDGSMAYGIPARVTKMIRDDEK